MEHVMAAFMFTVTRLWGQYRPTKTDKNVIVIVKKLLLK